MAENIEFTRQRAQATKAVQTSIAVAWTWDEKTLPQWDTAITSFVTQMETEQDAEADNLAKRGETDTAIDALHSLSGRCVRMAKNRYRDTPAKLEVTNRLRNDSASRAGKLQDALEWESAWEKLEPAWRQPGGPGLPQFAGPQAGADRPTARLRLGEGPPQLPQHRVLPTAALTPRGGNPSIAASTLRPTCGALDLTTTELRHA